MVRVKTVVTINAVDVSSKVFKWRMIDAINTEIPDMIIRFSRTVLNLLTVENGQEVRVTRGNTTGSEENVFIGNVDTVDEEYPFIVVKAKDKLIELVHTDINKTFDKNVDTEAGVGSAIAETIIESGDSTLTATVVSTGVTDEDKLDKFPCRKTDRFERLQVLNDIYGYQTYFDYDDETVHFEPEGNTTNTNTITVKATEVAEVPKWRSDNTQLINQIRVEGAEQLVETTETGTIGSTAGYTTTDVLLNFQPTSVKVFVGTAPLDDSDLKVGGTIDGTSVFDYSVDESERKIVWNTDQFTPGGSDDVEVRYSYPRPTPVLVKRNSSITSYGVSSTVKHFSDIKTVEDARKRGNLYLDTYAEPFTMTMLKVTSINNSYRVGQKVRVVDSVQSRDETLVINKVIKEWPHKFDQVHVGDMEYMIAEYNRLVLDKIKRLEEFQSKNDDFLVQVFENNFTYGFRHRAFTLQKEDRSQDSVLILSLNNGKSALTSGNVLGPVSGGPATETIRVTWPSGTFIESFIDTEFIGEGTATVNTTTGVLE